MIVSFDCSTCKNKLARGDLFDEWWELPDTTSAYKYYNIQCQECGTVTDFCETYKVSLELVGIEKEIR